MTDTQWVAVVVIVGVVALLAWAWGMTRFDERADRAQREQIKRGGAPVLGGRPEPRHVRRAKRP